MTRFALVPLLSSLLFSAPLFCADDPRIAALRSTVLSLRKQFKDQPQVPPATPEVTLAKHQLRDWIESRLATFPANGDDLTLAADLHAGLRDAQLFCDDDSECLPTAMGFLDEVQVNRERDFLTIQTAVGVGIWCGYDYSAYVFEWTGGAWRRVFESEQNDYRKGKYLPQLLHAIHISTADSDGSRLIMTLGSRTGCVSAFKPVYYRVWRLSANRDASKLLLDGTDLLNDESEPPVEGSVSPDDVLIEFAAGGTGYGSTHKAVRHFEVHGDSVKQVDPVAPTPRDFVEEWLSASWEKSAARSASPVLRDWHVKLHRDDGQGDFPEPAMRCSRSPELWQIGTHLHEGPETYYLVRWIPPYRFTMAGVGDRPDPDCTLRDPKGDAHPSLFQGRN